MGLRDIAVLDYQAMFYIDSGVVYRVMEGDDRPVPKRCVHAQVGSVEANVTELTLEFVLQEGRYPREGSACVRNDSGAVIDIDWKLACAFKAKRRSACVRNILGYTVWDARVVGLDGKRRQKTVSNEAEAEALLNVYRHELFDDELRRLDLMGVYWGDGV